MNKMNNFCEITSSKRIFANEYISEGIPFYRSKEIVEKQLGKLNISTEIYISESKFLEIKSKFGIPQKGDLLLTSVGTLGIPYVVKENEIFYFKDGNLTWFRNFKGLNSNYLYYWLLSPLGKAELKKATIGSSQSAYTINLLNNLTFIPPKLSIQEKVVDILYKYDQLIENNHKRIALLEESARLLYQEWFVRFRFPNCKIGDEGFPEGWTMCSLSDLVTLHYGKSLKESAREDGDIPVFGSSGIVGRHNKFLVKGPSIIVGRKGNVGSVYYTAEDCFAIDTVYFIKSEEVTFYNFFLLQSQDFVSSDTAVPGLNRNYAYSLKVLKPAQTLLKKFEDTVAPMFEQIQILSISIDQLQKARDELLPKLVSGKIKV